MFHSLSKAGRHVWRWSWLVTLPIALLFMVWALSTYRTYREFGLRFDTYSDKANLRTVMLYEYGTVKRRLGLAIKGNASPVENEASRVHLLIANDNELELNSNLPTSGRKYVEGFLQYPDGGLREVDLRYRGDFFWHWAMDKKSWRVKTDKAAMWNNMRKFNLIVPKSKAMVGGDLGYWLARDMGLIAPESEIVEVWVNGKPRGVHTQVEQLEELVLRKAGRMPGDLFAGELMGRGAYPGKPARVFHFPGIWEKVAINNHFEEEEETGVKHPNEPIFRLCEIIKREPSEEAFEELRSLVNYEAFGLFTAYRQLTQSAHYDNGHNWRLYYDPWRNKFEPVVWDPNAWQSSWLPRTPEQAFEVPFFCELDNFLAMDDQFRLASCRALTTYLQGGAEERLLRRYDKDCRSVRGAVKRDPDLAQFFSPITEAQVEQAMRGLRRSLIVLWGAYRDRHLNKEPLVASQVLWDAEVGSSVRIGLWGYQPIEALLLEFESGPMSLPAAYISYLDLNGERVEVDVSGGVRLEGASLRIQAPLMPGFRLDVQDERALAKRKAYVPEVRTYELRLVFESATQQAPLSIGYEATSGKVGAPVTTDFLEMTPAVRSFGVVLPNPVRPFQRWNGTMRISGKTTIPEPVIIEPGTVLEMEEGASIIVEGKVLARGTKDQPIIVRPALADQGPWGVLGVRGPGADNSQFEYCEMSGGSGWKRFLAEYSGMFSIHNAARVSITDCKFRDSKVVDDMVHAVYAKDILFRNCLFERSKEDSLDIDISSGRVENCEFVDSGNDSLDLMTSTIIVLDTNVTGSGDKAFSVGEGSHVILRNCMVENCVFGAQVKDGSTALIVHCDFVGNGAAIDAYKKNWRYNNGGEVHVHKCWFDRNGKTGTADKNSQVFFGDSFYSEAPTLSKDHRILLGRRNLEGPDTSKGRGVQSRKFMWLYGEPNPVKPFMQQDWPFPASLRRGTNGKSGRVSL